MGIIGVVAALTLPNLNSSTGDKEKVAKVKKIYSNLEDAYGRATAVYGPIDEWFKNDTTAEQKNKRFGERMTEFMKVSKTCGTSAGCFSSAPLLLFDGQQEYSNDLSNLQSYKFYMYILADGTSIAFNHQHLCLFISIDIDGPNKGKNQDGVDRFGFFIIDGELSPGGMSSLTGAFDDSYDIYWWVIQNDNMDYLKCASELNWQTKTSCK